MDSDRFAKMEMPITIPITKIGRALAYSDDHTQAALINSFAKELHVVCRGDEEMQVCAMSNDIDVAGEKLLRDLVEFLDLRKGGK